MLSLPELENSWLVARLIWIRMKEHPNLKHIYPAWESR